MEFSFEIQIDIAVDGDAGIELDSDAVDSRYCFRGVIHRSYFSNLLNYDPFSCTWP